MLADIIEQNSEVILESWTRRVDSTLAPGSPTETELRDHIPLFLKELVAVLRRGAASATSAAGQEHGRQRYNLGFDLPALVREYGLLSELILEMAEQQGRAVALGEVRVFNAFIAEAIAEGVAEHEHQRVQTERDTERRHSAQLSAQEMERRAAAEVLARQARHTGLVADVSQALAHIPEMRPMLQRCVQAFVDRLDAALARVWLLDATGKTLVLHASAGLDTTLDGPHGRVPVGQSLIGLIAQERRPHLTHSVVDDPQVADPEWARREGLVAFAGCPLLLGDKRVGVVALFARHPLPADTLDALRLVADTLALGVERVEAEARNEALLAQESAARAQAETEQQRLHDIFLRAPAAICVNEGPEHRYVLANPRYVAMVGGRDVLGKTVAQALPEVVEQGFVELLDTVYRTGVPYVGQETWLRLQRAPHAPLADICLNFVYQPIQDASGQTRSIFTHAVDVTELVLARREAQRSAEALRINERRLEDALAVTETGTWEMDPTTNGLTADPRFREMFGLTPEEPFDLAKGLAIIHAEDRERVAALVENALAGRDHGRYEADYRTVPRPDGSFRWVAARGQITFDASGRATRFLGTGTDITARKQAEFARTSLLRSLADQPVFGVAVHRGEELRIETANSVYRQLVGNRDVVGKPFLVALPEFAGQGADDGMREALRTGKSFSGREVSYHMTSHAAGDGAEERSFSFVWQPIFNPSGVADSLLVVTHDVTDQVRARQRVETLLGQLAASEERLRLVVEASGVGTYSWDLITQELVADARYYEFAGVPPGTQMTVEERIALVHLEDRPQVARVIHAARTGANGGRFHLEYRTTRLPDGRFRWLESTGHFFWDDQAMPRRLVGATQDITERKEAEALREEAHQRTQAESERQRLMFEQAPASIALLEGPEHRFRVANANYLQLVGGREVLGRSVAEALPEVVEQGLIALLDTVRRTGEPYVGRETWLRLQRHPGGPLEEVCLNFVYQPVRDASGQVDTLFFHAVEVTDLVRSREVAQRTARELEALAESLRRSETRLALALEVSGTGMWEMDLKTGRFSMDSRFREMLGLTRDEPVTLETGLTFVHPEDRALVANGVADALAGKKGGAYAAEYRTVRQADGSYRWVSARGQAHFGPEGKAVHLAGTGLDITESVRARERAEALAQQERTRAEFAQQLIGIVSHDLRNPLSAIRLGAATLLRREGLDPKSRRTVERIQSATDRAERMVRDLLDFTQVRLAGGLKIERQPADLHELVRGVVQEVEEAQPGVRIRQEARGEGRGAWDADRLQQVVQNLVTNALKYGTPGECVSVFTEGHTDTVTLGVHNPGEPIPPERQASLFQPMQRGVEGVDRQGRSVGLGLFIVRAIVEAHGGTIALASRAGEGTTFRIVLPREAPQPTVGTTRDAAG